MNKIKTLYDVVQTLKAQEKFEGNGTVKVTKDKEAVFEAEKTFEKDIANGTMKGKIKTEVQHDGVKLKNESEFEFDKNSCGGHGFGGHHGMGMRKRMMQGRGHGCHGHQGRFNSEESCEDGKGFHQRGGGFPMKRKLDKISMMFDLLNRLEITESDNGGKDLKLEISLNDMPEEMRRHMKMHMMHGKAHGPHGKHFSDFESVEDIKVRIDGNVDDSNKIKALQINMNGVYLDTEESSHTIDLTAQMSLD